MFDYTQKDLEIPMRYNNSISTSKPNINGTWVDYGSVSSSEAKFPYCDIEQTDGMLLTSGSQSTNNISCNPHVYNAGNYYNFPATSAKSNTPTLNSVCSLGWGLPENDSNTSYSNLLMVYGIDFNAGDKMVEPYDAALLNFPLSFLRSGYYDRTGALYGQGSYGYYRMTSLRLVFNSGLLSPANDTLAGNGYSVRCVSR